MAETRAEWAVTSAGTDSSDTDSQAANSVFVVDEPADQSSPASAVHTSSADKSSAELNAEIDATRAHLDQVVEKLEERVEAKVESVQETVAQTKRLFDLRRLVTEHPIAATAVALSAIGVGMMGYRFVRHSLPIRMYLAFRFGRLRELFPV